MHALSNASLIELNQFFDSGRTRGVTVGRIRKQKLNQLRF